MKRTLLQSAAILMAAIIFCSTFAMPFAKADADFPARTVNLLILYDQSYESFFAEECSINDPVHRLEQVVKLAEVPFKEKLNITLNVTISSYQSVLGNSYAMSCPTIYPVDTPVINSCDPHYWEYEEQCECAGLDDSSSDPHSRHHTSMRTLLDDVTAYINGQSVYDAAFCYFCFNGCNSCIGNITHRHPPGIAYRYGVAGVAGGNHSISDTTYQSMNLTSCVGLFWHEFSHTFGLKDGTNDFITNPDDNCTENYPCTMSGGFDKIIYAPNVWCPNCLYKLSENGGGLAGHYDHN